MKKYEVTLTFDVISTDCVDLTVEALSAEDAKRVAHEKYLSNVDMDFYAGTDSETTIQPKEEWSVAELIPHSLEGLGYTYDLSFNPELVCIDLNLHKISEAPYKLKTFSGFSREETKAKALEWALNRE